MIALVARSLKEEDSIPVQTNNQSDFSDPRVCSESICEG